MLEADVNFKVVKEFIDRVQAKAVGQEVMTALSPAQQIVKIVHDELVEVLGKDTAKLKFASQPPSVILMAGLQGSGKTTTSGKIAAWLKKGGHRPMLVSVDVYRPAARQQLKVVAEAIKANLYEGKVETSDTPTVERLVKEARKEAINSGCNFLIVDTAGRLHIDDELMAEMQSLKKILNPQEILFVADAMTGQDAVRSADEFHKKLSITGVVLTKMDGDARGGAALSIRQVTGQPIKFIGVGEKYDAIEPFHPDRIVGRILGMGDILTLVEKAQETVDQKKAQEFAQKALGGEGFSLEDFRDQLRQVKKLGSLQSVIKMLPSIGPFAGHAEGRRFSGRKPDHPRGSHHQLHDAERAQPSRDHQRQPAQAHRSRLRHQRAGSEPASAPVCPDAQNVQGHGQVQLQPQAGRNETAGNDAVAFSFNPELGEGSLSSGQFF